MMAFVLDERQLIQAVDYFLRNVGLDPTTLPSVMINNRIPSSEEERKLKELQEFLKRYDLITTQGYHRVTPGGWLRIQVSEKGYQLRTDQSDQLKHLVKEEMHRRYCEQMAANDRINTYPGEKRAPFDQFDVDEDEGYPPNWWHQAGGEFIYDYYDPDYEQPKWWAKYRLERKMELRLSEKEFPVTLKEKTYEYIFARTSPLGRKVIGSLLLFLATLLILWSNNLL